MKDETKTWIRYADDNFRSAYLPSKYPLGGALPDFEPNDEICRKTLTIAERVRNSILPYINRLQTSI